MPAYHHGNLRESLIQAGDEELKLHGPEQLSLREIAKRAGVSHNAPYRHFSSKHELIDLIIEKTLIELAEQIESAPLLYPASTLMQIQYVGRLWAHMVQHYPRKAHLIFSGLSTKGHHQAGHALIHQNVVSILSESSVTAPDTNQSHHFQALALIAAFRGLALMLTSETVGMNYDREEDIPNLFDQVCENILAR